MAAVPTGGSRENFFGHRSDLREKQHGSTVTLPSRSDAGFSPILSETVRKNRRFLLR
jgi:hypothetical protein